MNNNATECRPGLSLVSFLRRGGFFLALICSSALHAQLTTLTETYRVPHRVDGAALSVFFDFSSQLSHSSGALSHTTLSIDFGKIPDLADDAPFYSEMGLVLRKLDTDFSVLSQVTLMELGSFSDGAAFSFFDGVITFDDTASGPFNQNPDQPMSGVFQGGESLGLLDGTFSPFWELRVVDAAFQNPLLFHSASLTFMVGSAVPEPSSMGWAGVGLLGAGVLYRRRHKA